VRGEYIVAECKSRKEEISEEKRKRAENVESDDNKTRRETAQQFPNRKVTCITAWHWLQIDHHRHFLE
jgi:hypothetical protein